MAIVAVGFSSVTQWPACGMLAANCMIFAMVVPNDFSPPIASTGMESLPLARNLLVVASILVKRGELHETGMHCA
jgi:hypothetical protein